MGAEGIQQKRQERVHASDCRTLGYQAGSETAAFESIEQRTAARDHMNRHVPRSALAAHSGGRLVISDENHDEIATGPLPEVPAEHGEVIRQRFAVSRSKVHPV